MKSKKKRGLPLISVLVAVILAACASQVLGEGSSEVDLMTPAQESPAMQLAAGTLQLQDTDSAITLDQSSELRTLWNAYAVLAESDGVADAELEAVLTQIQEAMTDAQLAAIEDMEIEMAQAAGNSSESGSEAAATGQAGGPPSDMALGGEMGGDMTQMSPDQMQGTKSAGQGAGGGMAVELATQVVEMLDSLATE